MLVNFPKNKFQREVPLHHVKSGKLVELTAPGDSTTTSIYMVCRASAVENITVPHGRIILVNVETGRIVFKNPSLEVRELSGRAVTKYLQSDAPVEATLPLNGKINPLTPKDDFDEPNFNQ